MPSIQDKKMKNIVLHIGMHKTGTSTIQQNLFENRQLLRRFGIVYPNLAETGANHSSALYSYYCDHSENYHMNIREGRTTKNSLDKFHNTIKNDFFELSNQHWQTLILSAEDVSNLNEGALEKLYKDLRGYFTTFSLTVVFGIRNPVTYWVSKIQEHIKNGESTHSLYETLKVEDSYKATLTKLTSVFGKDLHLFKFEDAIKKNLTMYFLDNFVKVSHTVRFNDTPSNSSISQESFYLIDAINERFPFFVGSHINKDRKEGDVDPLILLEGAKCVDVKLNSDQKAAMQNELKFLQRSFGLSWKVVKQGAQRILWSEAFFYQLNLAMNELNEPLNVAIVDSLRDLAIEIKSSQPQNAFRMLCFCYEHRPEGTVIRENLKELAQKCGIDVTL